ncbi:MAG: DNA polymerase III subunit delta [Bacillota bacterium]
MNNLVLVYGNQYSVDETINRIKSKINYEEFIKIDGESLSVKQIEDAICSLDMFSGIKLFLINGFPKEKPNDLIKIFPNIPPSNIIIFYSYSSVKAKKKLCNFFSKNAKLIEYDVEVKNIDRIIKNMVESVGKKIENDVLDLMVEYLGSNMGIVKSEVDKLLNYIDDKKEVKIEDVKSVCCLNKEFVIWDLIQNIANKDVSKAMVILSSAIENGCSYEFIILMLMRSIRLGIFLKDLEKEGLNIYEMAERIKEYKKSNGSSIYRDYEIRKTYEARNSFYSNYSNLELCHSLNKCHDTFLNVRKFYKKEEQEKEVSMLLFEICFPSTFIKRS